MFLAFLQGLAMESSLQDIVYVFFTHKEFSLWSSSTLWKKLLILRHAFCHYWNLTGVIARNLVASAEAIDVLLDDCVVIVCTKASFSISKLSTKFSWKRMTS